MSKSDKRKRDGAGRPPGTRGADEQGERGVLQVGIDFDAQLAGQVTGANRDNAMTRSVTAGIMMSKAASRVHPA